MIMKVHILHCGAVRVDIAVPYRQNTLHPAAYTGFFRSKKHRTILPVSCYLIEHPKGRILIDTSWHRDVRTQAMKHLGLIHYLVNKPILPQGQAIDEQLEHLGLSPKDLDCVVLTHLHDDHASGLALVKEAKRIVVSDVEYQKAMSSPLMYERKFWAGIDLECFEYDRELSADLGRGLVTMYHDLLGDGSVLLVNTPGHTLGMSAILLRGESGYIILCADAAYSQYAIDNNILPGITVDDALAQRSLDWLRLHNSEPNCLGVYANHDRDIKPHIIEL